MNVFVRVWRRIAQLSLGSWMGRGVLLLLFVGVIGFFVWLVMRCETIMGGVVDVFRFARAIALGERVLSSRQAVVNALLVAPFLFLVFYQIWHWIIHSSSRGGRKPVCLEQLNNDPIETDEEDELARGDFVQQVISVLLGRYLGRHALFVGVYGAWGEGKTSVLNLVQRKLIDHRRVVFVKFQSWEHESKEDLPYVLFMQIARRIADRLDLWTAWLLVRYAVQLVPRRLISIAGPFEWILDVIVRFSNAFSSVADLARRIERRLSTLDAKVIVVVDDVDRLEKDDVRMLLRVLRTVGDISRFVYCVLANRDYLAGCIQELKPEGDPDGSEFGRHYLRKVINLELELPRVPKSALTSIFIEKINKILIGYGLAEYSSSAPAIVFFNFFVQTYRDVLRLVNELIVRLGYFKGKSLNQLVVNVDDLVALSIIHLFDPTFWQAIYDHHELIVRTNEGSLLSKRQIAAKVVDGAFGLSGTDAINTDVRKKFLSQHLGLRPGNDNSGNSVYHYEVDQRQAELNRRLCALACFHMYYSGVVPVLVEAGVLNGVIKRLSDEAELIAFLREQNKKGILMRVLEYLEIMDRIEDRKSRMNYVCALMRLADERLEPERGVGRDAWGLEASFGFATRLMRCILFVLEKSCSKRTDAGAEFLQAVCETETIVLLAEAVRMDDREAENMPRKGYLFTNDGYNSAKELFIAYVERLQAKGQLIDHVEEEDVRRTWCVLLQGNRLGSHALQCREHYLALMKEDAEVYPNILHVLLPYRYYGDRGVFDFSPLWCRHLDDDFGIDSIMSVFERQKGLPDFAKQILDNLRFCQSYHKRTGEWPHPDSQVAEEHKRRRTMRKDE